MNTEHYTQTEAAEHNHRTLVLVWSHQTGNEQVSQFVTSSLSTHQNPCNLAESGENIALIMTVSESMIYSATEGHICLMAL